METTGSDLGLVLEVRFVAISFSCRAKALFFSPCSPIVISSAHRPPSYSSYLPSYNIMIIRLCSLLISTAAVVSAYTTPKQQITTTRASQNQNNAMSKAFATAASASLAFVLVGSPLNAVANSKTAGQISLNSVPPTSINVDIKDLPVVGDLLSGTYTRVNSVKDTKGSPSVSIKSPKDKLGAIQAVATGGHLEFDIDGLVTTHLDIDVATDEAGVLNARVASPLIPKLPFKNAASKVDGGGVVAKKNGKGSDWAQITNLGNNEVYYYNFKTDESTFDKPAKI